MIGSTALVFDAAPRNPLLGTWRVAAYGVPSSTVTSLVELLRVGSMATK